MIDTYDQLLSEIDKLRNVLERCRSVLGHMAIENEPNNKWEEFIYIFNRWPINHEPLRADAKALLPIIDEVLNDHD